MINGDENTKPGFPEEEFNRAGMLKLKNNYDVVIFGAGVAGLITGISLSARSMSVLIVDSAPGITPKIGEALPSKATPLLKALGIKTGDFEKWHIPCYLRKSAWGNPGLISYDSVFDPYGHGWILDRKLFDSRLAAVTVNYGADLFRDTMLSQLSFTNSSADITLKSGNYLKNISAKFIVDATGRKRNIARSLNISSVKYDMLFSFHYIIKNCKSNFSDLFDCQSFTESCEQGWWYSSVLPGNNRIISFYTNSGTEDFYLAGTRDGFKAVLNKTEYTKHILPDLDQLPASKPISKYANSSMLHAISGSRWLAVGDAAATFDPLSSQGLFTALQMGMMAGDAIYKMLTEESDHLITEFSAVYKSAFNDYLEERSYYYSMEQRWADSLFWKMNTTGKSLKPANKII